MGDFEKRLNEMRSKMNADIKETLFDAREKMKRGEKVGKIIV